MRQSIDLSLAERTPGVSNTKAGELGAKIMLAPAGTFKIDASNEEISMYA